MKTKLPKIPYKISKIVIKSVLIIVACICLIQFVELYQLNGSSFEKEYTINRYNSNFYGDSFNFNGEYYEPQTYDYIDVEEKYKELKSTLLIGVLFGFMFIVNDYFYKPEEDVLFKGIKNIIINCKNNLLEGEDKDDK